MDLKEQIIKEYLEQGCRYRTLTANLCKHSNSRPCWYSRNKHTEVASFDQPHKSGFPFMLMRIVLSI